VVRWLQAYDLVRTGTAIGCRVGAPTGSGASWTVVVTGCSEGTVGLSLSPRTVADEVSNWGPVQNVNAPTLVIDRTAPVAGVPRSKLRSPIMLPPPGTGAITSLTWRATDAGGAGLAGYDVARSLDGGPFEVIWSRVPTAYLGLTLEPGHTYRLKVRARDRAGNVGAWTVGPLVTPSLVQQGSRALTYRGDWRTAVHASHSGGRVRYASAAGAAVTLTFTGRSVAWVTTLGPDRGAAKVYVDGMFAGTINTYASTLRFRMTAFARSWARSGSHTIRIVVVGSAGHPRVDLDALEILR
ncbi:MAG: fibronectin type III domain-containing protein, partial [Chloroflexi bacterium]|nr:fibronectin type III domain-containing protein [Chloroflexota bacterium]